MSQPLNSMRILSGGQTGVDRAALDVALELGMVCGGWCPRGRRAEDGRIPEDYPLKETMGAGYRARTQANVRDSQATLILMADPDSALGGGTALTAKEANRLAKPLLIVEIGNPKTHDLCIADILSWIAANDFTVLNVAGPRESTSPGIYVEARRVLTRVLSALIQQQA